VLNKYSRILWSLCAVGLLGSCSPAAHAEEITPQSVEARLASGDSRLVLVDVRSEAEFKRGHIPGALHLPHDRAAPLLAALETHRDKTVVTYCQSGGRAGRVNRALLAAGFSDVRHLRGDLPGWVAAGLPTEP